MGWRVRLLARLLHAFLAALLHALLAASLTAWLTRWLTRLFIRDLRATFLAGVASSSFFERLAMRGESRGVFW